MEIMHSFYQDLYTSQGIDREQMTKNIETITDHIDEQDRDMLNAPITTEEVRKAIKNLKKGKSPGNDGLTAEFYQHFIAKLLGDKIFVACRAHSAGFFPIH